MGIMKKGNKIMFYFKKTNQNGVVLITVLMISIVLMTLTVSVLSMNVNHALISEQEIRRTQAEILARGALGLTIAEQMTAAAPSDTIQYTKDINNITFNIVSNLIPTGTGYWGTDKMDISVDF